MAEAISHLQYSRGNLFLLHYKYCLAPRLLVKGEGEATVFMSFSLRGCMKSGSWRIDLIGNSWSLYWMWRRDSYRWEAVTLFNLLYLTLLHLPPLRFHCVGGCWDRTQDYCNQGCGSGSGIRIRIGSVFNRVCGSGSGFGIRIRIQEGKNDPQK
jgi:hypothetical protein